MADEVGIREFKNEASAYIERVEAGEVVTITKRGRPVARVVPAAMAPGMVQLITEGRLRWTGGKPGLRTRVRLSGDGPTAADYVSEGRG